MGEGVSKSSTADAADADTATSSDDFKTTNVLEVSRQSHKKQDFFNIHNNEIANRLSKIKNIRNLFSFEGRQVDTLISLAWSSNKLSDPVGLTYGEILETLVREHLYYLYRTNTYLRSLLNTLIQPTIDILELAPENARFSLTGFGMAYYWAGDGRYI